jgi:response regulator RpfG family c-di-GMP phosphodiesterase
MASWVRRWQGASAYRQWGIQMSGADCAQPWPKLLVIDDNRENLALFRAVLEDESYVVQCASSGSAGS